MALAILPDGRIQTGGRVRALRFTPAGQPDQSFGVGGIVPLPDTAPTDLKNAAGVAVDGQGRTLIAGSFQPGGGQTDRTAVLRLNPDGSRDVSFGGSDGIVDVDVNTTAGQTETAQAVLVQPDGRIVLVGTVGSDANKRASVVRLNANGAPDPTFAGDGSVVFGAVTMDAERGTLTPSGDLLVSGNDQPANVSTPAAAFVARVRPNGTLDPAFGVAGIARSPVAVQQSASDVVQLPDGRVRQLASSAPDTDLLATRGILNGYTATGGPDPAVGPGGQRVYDLSPGAGTLLSSMTLGGDRLWVGGTRDARFEGVQVRGRSVLLRMTTDGALDTGFSGDGQAIRDDRDLVVTTAIVLDAAGRPVTAGWQADPSTGKVSTRIARHLAVDDPPPPAPPAPVTVTTTVTVPAPTPTPTVARPPSAASVLVLSSARRCVSSRRVRLTVRRPAGLTVRKVTVKVGSGRTRTVKAPVRIALTGRPKGKVKVLVTATLSSGATVRRTVTYTLCAAKKRR